MRPTNIETDATPGPSLDWHDIAFTVRDGLRLNVRCYPAVEPTHRRPVICLPGLTQTAQEFDDLAAVLAHAGPLSRDVYAVDYRGRGRSDYDDDWRNYTPFLEMLDVLDFLAMRRLHDVAVVGSSRGGIVAMIMAAVRPAAIGAVVLNDIGPTIEAAGWMRQMGRVGRTPIPNSWDEAARYLRELHKDEYPRLTVAMWQRLAHQRYLERGGRPAAAYDAAISRAFSLNSIAAGMPSLWPQFRAICRVPLLLVRGELSDVLSAKTVSIMESLHPRMRSFVALGQGHAPLLGDDATAQQIAAFLVDTDDDSGTLDVRTPNAASSTSARSPSPSASQQHATDRVPPMPLQRTAGR